MKRLFDILVAVCLLILVAPVMLILAAAVWLGDQGPVLYAGQRIGYHGRSFRMLKFRSMKVNSASGGLSITAHGDQRITSIGRILRATKLDELPQLLNVLAGDMSLVGPRPEAPEYVQLYSEPQLKVLHVRPGITGPSQIVYRHEELLLEGSNPVATYLEIIMPAKLSLDIAYVNHHSLRGDLSIIWQTVWALFTPPKTSVDVFTMHSPMETQTMLSQEKTPSIPSHAIARAWHWMIVRRARNYGPIVVLDICFVTVAFVGSAAFNYAVATHRITLKVNSGTTYVTSLLPAILISALLYAVFAYLLALHRRIWRFVHMRDGVALFLAIVLTGIVVVVLHTEKVAFFTVVPDSVTVLGLVIAFLGIGTAKIVPPALAASRVNPHSGSSLRVLIAGAGQAGATLASRFPQNSDTKYRVVGFVDDDQMKWRYQIQGRPIFGPIAMIPDLVEDQKIDLVAIALPSVSAQRISEIIALCQQTTARIKILPGVYELIDGAEAGDLLREVNVAELLGREIVPLHFPVVQQVLEGETILVTGAAGSIGSELCHQLLNYMPSAVIGLDNNETGLFDLAARLEPHLQFDRFRMMLADFTSIVELDRILAQARPRYIFHAAAYKHVPMLETFPEEAGRTNVIGTYDLCMAAVRHEVDCFVFVSTDKAAAPVSMLGASKRLGEETVRFLASSQQVTRFSAVRFGNVIQSRGSIVPTFTQQINRGGPITVTHPDVTRFFMTVGEACGLVILIGAIANSGDLFALDMGSPVRIVDLAEKMIRSRGLRVGKDIQIQYTGLRPGDKMRETLISTEEMLVATEYPKVLRVLPTALPQPESSLPDRIEQLRRALILYPETVDELVRDMVRTTVSIHT